MRIVVDDDGRGLSAAEREQVATRGRRLDETKPGSGLGLSIVIELAGALWRWADARRRADRRLARRACAAGRDDVAPDFCRNCCVTWGRTLFRKTRNVTHRNCFIVAALALRWRLAPAAHPEGPGPKENSGTVLGAVSGAVIGSQLGNSTGAHVTGAVVGAGIGALIGNRIGAAMDDDDKRRAYAAQIDALNDAARRARRYPGATPIPAATAPSFQGPITSRRACAAALIPTPSISTAGRRPCAAPPAAIRTEAGPH